MSKYSTSICLSPNTLYIVRLKDCPIASDYIRLHQVVLPVNMEVMGYVRSHILSNFEAILAENVLAFLWTFSLLHSSQYRAPTSDPILVPPTMSMGTPVYSGCGQ